MTRCIYIGYSGFAGQNEKSPKIKSSRGGLFAKTLRPAVPAGDVLTIVNQEQHDTSKPCQEQLGVRYMPRD